MLTTHAVVTEAWHLVSPAARLPLTRFVREACEIGEFDEAGRARIFSALERYADIPMDYADATLLALAETENVGAIATVDVNDFSAYRLNNGRALKLVF